MPQLTEERRKELVRLVHKMAEEARVAVRNVRRDVLNELKRAEKDGDVSRDELARAQDEVQKLTDAEIKPIDELMAPQRGRDPRGLRVGRSDVLTRPAHGADRPRAGPVRPPRAPSRRGGEVPESVAIIMDGNGRWARERHLPVGAGHRAGARALKRVVRAAADTGIKDLTVFSFSTENWSRPDDEVGDLMGLFCELIDREVPELNEERVQHPVHRALRRARRRAARQDRPGRGDARRATTACASSWP